MAAEFPEKLEFLFQPARYKIAYGGRGGAKSWGVARALLIQAASRPLRVLCAREFQRSIVDSVHKLLADQVAALGLGDFYQIQNTTIRGRNGSEFAFAGLRHNVSGLKSFEGVDIAWVEEAQTVSKASWDILIPTIRKSGSEIWLTFNPELETDETYQRFVLRPPPGAVVAKVGWQDNPWFPDVLRAEKDDLKARDPDAYLHVWEGHCRQALEGAVYAEEIRRATEEGRIGRAPVDPSKPVHTFWDLGWSDNVSVWMAQTVAMEFRVVDFLQSSRKPITWYVAELQKRPYAWGTDWLPHDGDAETLAAAGRTIRSQMEELGRRVEIVPNVDVADGINAARTIFPQCWFDQERCADGLHALRHYQYEFDEDLGTLKRKPRHDWASHAADAFRYMSVAIRHDAKPKRRNAHYAGAGAWMG